LPADRAYAETCAAIANFMWNWRMLLRTGDAQFADEMERGLYNVIAASTAISGTEFFYVNPLQLREGNHSEGNASTSRRSWFTCACCPPNIARLIASLDTYAATRTDNGLQLHLYSDGAIALNDDPDAPVAIVSTDYPWDGRVSIALDRPLDCELRLRVPAWAQETTVIADDSPAEFIIDHGYLVVPAGSVSVSIELDFHAEPLIVRPHPRLDGARGTVAVQRGPIVYCLERVDLPSNVNIEDVYLSGSATLRVESAPDGLDAPAITTGDAVVRNTTGVALYSRASARPATEIELTSLALIPYFRWGNRRQTAMRVWIPTR
jgi:DUF1680 family protein